MRLKTLNLVNAVVLIDDPVPVQVPARAANSITKFRLVGAALTIEGVGVDHARNGSARLRTEGSRITGMNDSMSLVGKRHRSNCNQTKNDSSNFSHIKDGIPNGLSTSKHFFDGTGG